MVISCTVYQLLEFIIDSFTDRMRSTEIHWSTFHFQYFTCRNRYFIDGNIKISVDGNYIV